MLPPQTSCWGDADGMWWLCPGATWCLTAQPPALELLLAAHRVPNPICKQLQQVLPASS